jgi:hypothetical protein
MPKRASISNIAISSSYKAADRGRGSHLNLLLRPRRRAKQMGLFAPQSVR